ncbi:glycoside hydrolase family 5 protein [Flagelloscypha sp. PMI_526]|nr:glycoside hydrolase family 5 protein [Flagelloscypha sp. PMI_526]
MNHPMTSQQPVGLYTIPSPATYPGVYQQPLQYFPHAKRRRNPWMITVVVFVTLAVIALAVVLPVYFVILQPNMSSSSSSSPSNSGSPTGATTGGDGSTVRLENGSDFTYYNPFGGFWVHDASNPFADTAQPNSWTPPLNQPWDWTKNRINGVNLGGLFVLEPFITPEIFQRYPSTQDEFGLSRAMAADTANGGLSQLETHYDTFITEQDIAEIAGAGLNFLRIPIPFWAIETWDGEPYLAKVSWKYILRVIEWARKYGLRVSLDLHTVPGSQNGYNHSGKLSSVNFLAGNMGYANAQRTLYYLRVFTEFISQPEYRNVVVLFGIVNEALLTSIGMNSITSFYLEAHAMMRDITGMGSGNGPYIVLHDGFQEVTAWDNFMAGSDRVILDQHPYFSFSDVFLTDPIVAIAPDGNPGGVWPRRACDVWGNKTDIIRRTFGLVVSGEFSAGPNDCGLYIRGIANARSNNPQCPQYDDWQHYNATMKQGLLSFVSASMDILGDWFFWTWKIGPTVASQGGQIEAPLWSYQLGLREGWIPRDPRNATGKCSRLGSPVTTFNGPYVAWQTGDINPSVRTSIAPSSSSAYPWPPKSINGAIVSSSAMPSYTETGVRVVLPVPTFTGAPPSATRNLNGWFKENDDGRAIVPIAGCQYPNEYDGVFPVGATPTAACKGT